MQGDAEAIHNGVTTLSYGRSMVDGMCNRLEQAVSDAERSNAGRRFKKCTQTIRDVVKKMRASAQDLARIGQTMERLEYIIRELDGE